MCMPVLAAAAAAHLALIAQQTPPCLQSLLKAELCVCCWDRPTARAQREVLRPGTAMVYVEQNQLQRYHRIPGDKNPGQFLTTHAHFFDGAANVEAPAPEFRNVPHKHSTFATMNRGSAYFREKLLDSTKPLPARRQTLNLYPAPLMHTRQIPSSTYRGNGTFTASLVAGKIGSVGQWDGGVWGLRQVKAGFERPAATFCSLSASAAAHRIAECMLSLMHGLGSWLQG